MKKLDMKCVYLHVKTHNRPQKLPSYPIYQNNSYLYEKKSVIAGAILKT